MNPAPLAVGVEFEGIWTGYILVVAVLVCIALVALTFWFVLRDDPPNDERDERTERTDEGW